MPARIVIDASNYEWHPVLLVLKDMLEKVPGRSTCRDFVDLQQVDVIQAAVFRS